jgi:hypothetical protein
MYAVVAVSSPDLSTLSIKNNDMSPNEPDPYVHDESSRPVCHQGAALPTTISYQCTQLQGYNHETYDWLRK